MVQKKSQLKYKRRKKETPGLAQKHHWWILSNNQRKNNTNLIWTLPENRRGENFCNLIYWTSISLIPELEKDISRELQNNILMNIDVEILLKI